MSYIHVQTSNGHHHHLSLFSSLPLYRCITWAESNILQEMLPDYIDPQTGRKFGITVKGWRSNHLGDGGAVGWCTAQVRYLLHTITLLDLILVIDMYWKLSKYMNQRTEPGSCNQSINQSINQSKSVLIIATVLLHHLLLLLLYLRCFWG